MKIHISINHPAHVHYFKNFIKIMEKKGHSFVVTNRDSKIINQLLDAYGIEHIIRNKRPNNMNKFSRILVTLRALIFSCWLEIKYKTDLSLGFASLSCAFAAWVRRKPSILLDDTEHNKTNRNLYLKFCSNVLTPFYYGLNIGEKQIFMNAYIEQLYLHSKNFVENESVLELYGLEKGKYILFRYIAYDAWHDKDAQPISMEDRKELVCRLAEKYKVCVSLESSVKDPFFDKYLLKNKPEHMHDIMDNCAFMIVEGATMASEAAMLGVPYIYINPLQNLGYIKEQVKDYPDFFYMSTDIEEVNKIIDGKLVGFIDNNERRDEIRRDIEFKTINPTDFLVWFVENYPESVKIMKENPQYQFNFK